MSTTANDWIKHIHSNTNLGAELLQVNDWDSYFGIAKREGFSFTKEDLDAAWGNAFGDISEGDLNNIVGGTKPPPRPPSAVMGVRG